jgi:16S rRNA (guanine(966)-N(2))-methyltransferase RsmD
VRISGGSAKGRKVGLRKVFLKKGEADELRPTSAKVREALFSILALRIADARFLDLYAGTGAVGLEALSRGAAHAVFVEENSARVKVLRETLQRFGFGDSAEVVRDTAERFIERCGSVFDIIFVDPPYASAEVEAILPLIQSREIMHEDGIVVVEHAAKRPPPERLDGLERGRVYRYGDTSVSLYTKKHLQSEEQI